MNARNLRLVVRLDGGGRLGVALIRHGAPVPGIGPGGGDAAAASGSCAWCCAAVGARVALGW